MHKTTMKNIYTEMKKRRMAKEKAASKVTDAKPLIKYLLENAHKFTDEERKDFTDNMHKSFADVGKTYIQRAIREKIMTKKEVKAWQNLGIDDAAFCTIFMPIFAEMDGHLKPLKDNKTILITTEKTKLYKHRKMIMKRFSQKFEIVGPKEALKYMEEAKNEIKRHEKA